jgi:guanylate kinase
MSHWSEFDYVLVNEDVEAAADELAGIVAGRPGGHATGDLAVQARIAAILPPAAP